MITLPKLQVYFVFKNKRRWKISAYFHVIFEYKRMRLFLSVYSILLQEILLVAITIHLNNTFIYGMDD